MGGIVQLQASGWSPGRRCARAELTSGICSCNVDSGAMRRRRRTSDFQGAAPMSASLKSQLRAAADRWLERSGLRDPEYRLHSATLAIIYTGFWLLVLAGLAIYAGHRSNTAQWV